MIFWAFIGNTTHPAQLVVHWKDSIVSVSKLYRKSFWGLIFLFIICFLLNEAFAFWRVQYIMLFSISCFPPANKQFSRNSIVDSEQAFRVYLTSMGQKPSKTSRWRKFQEKFIYFVIIFGKVCTCFHRKQEAQQNCDFLPSKWLKKETATNLINI